MHFRSFLCVFLIFTSLISQAESIFNNKIAIEISGCKSKTTTFTISCNNARIASQIKNNLNITNRFRAIDTSSIGTDTTAMLNAGIDVFIKIVLIEEKIHVEIFDVLQKKLIKSITVSNSASFEEVTDELSNQIYKAWLAEEAPFNTRILFAQEISPDLSTIAQAKYTNAAPCSISPPIAYCNGLVAIENRIFLTKFCTKKRGFAIFSYDETRKQFFRELSIQASSVFSPVVNKRMLYFSVAANGTTGIYCMPEFSEIRQFRTFKEFEKSPQTRALVKIYGKIATSISIYGNTMVFCSNAHGRPALFLAKANQEHKQISDPNATYYDPALFGEHKVAAVKICDGQFNLVVIDLTTGAEKTLFSKYYIAKPVWSPCGNWLAISCRARGEKDEILLIHKSGQYTRKIESAYTAKSPVWIYKKY